MKTKVKVLSLACNSKDSAEAMTTLMEYCQSVEVQDGLVSVVDIGIEGWAALGKALSQNVGNWIVSTKAGLVSARREDLRTIWNYANRGWAILQEDNMPELFEEWHLFEEYLDAEEDVNRSEDEDGDEDNDS